VLDFGLAKLLENESAIQHIREETFTSAVLASEEPGNPRLTRAGTRMGTAYYMSPEQVREEELDTRTDLFSLGLVIYEMVTGRRGFTGEDADAIHEATLHRELTPVRQLSPSVPAAMEQFIEKALRKDRNCRYQSAQEMVEDLEVLRDKLQPRMHWKRPRRLALAAAVFLTVAAGAGMLVERFWHVPSSQPNVQVKSRRSVAVLGFRNLSGKAADDWISTALAEMASTELASGGQLRIIPGENIARMKLDLALPTTVGYGTDTLKKIRRNLDTDTVVQGSYLLSSANKLRIDLKIQDSETGETIAAVSEEGSDAQIASLVTQAGGSLRRQLRIADVASDALDKNRATLPTDSQAARFYSEGVAKIRIFDASAARDLFMRAIAIEPDHALTHSLLAESLAALGNDAQARAEAKRAFELSSTLPRENQLLIEGRYRELSHDHVAALETYRTLWKFFPDNLEYGLKVAKSQNDAGVPRDELVTARQLQQLPGATGADPRIDMAEATASSSLGDFNGSLQFAVTAVQKARLQESPLLESEARYREGWALDRLGQFDKAFAADSEARDLARAGGNLRLVARDLDGMGGVLYDKGDMEGARKIYEEALEVARQAGAQLMIATAYNDIGNVLYTQGKLAEARRSYQQCLDIDRSIGYKAGIAGSLGNLANVVQGMGDLRGATRMQDETLQAFRDIGDKRGESSTMTNLGLVLSDRGQLNAAKKILDESMSVVQQTGYPRGRIKSLIALSDIFLSMDRLPEAHKAIVAAVSQSREVEDEFDVASSEMQQAVIEMELGKNSEAASLARSAAREYAKQKVVSTGCFAEALLSLALLAEGDLKEAQAAYDEAAALYQQGPDREAWFELTIAGAAVKSKTGHATEGQAMLEDAIKQASRDGYFGYELKSELLLGEIEITSGKVSSGMLRLKRLQAQSQAASFNLIAREAKTALGQIH
ncbi:MAG: tetratricopeptide repeat protein, partial [Terracidiphilus sp.]